MKFASQAKETEKRKDEYEGQGWNLAVAIAVCCPTVSKSNGIPAAHLPYESPAVSDLEVRCVLQTNGGRRQRRSILVCTTPR